MVFFIEEHYLSREGKGRSRQHIIKWEHIRMRPLEKKKDGYLFMGAKCVICIISYDLPKR